MWERVKVNTLSDLPFFLFPLEIHIYKPDQLAAVKWLFASLAPWRMALAVINSEANSFFPVGWVHAHNGYKSLILSV